MPDPATAILASSAGSAIANIWGANNAADDMNAAMMQANGMITAQQAKALQTFMDMFNQAKVKLDPFMETGTNAAQQLDARMGDLTAPISMTQDELEKTPGYKFLMTQGMRGVTGSNVLRGLSGAQIKGAEDFMKGLADTTYKTQFDIANTNKTNAFNRLFTTAGIGSDAAKALLNASVSGGSAILGNSATVGGQLSGNRMMGGQADAAADIAIGKQIGDAVGGMPYAPYIGNKLYPTVATPAASGMYGPSGAQERYWAGGNTGPI
jgi:hypothetical protein